MCCVYPSEFEGFGIPVLEAFQHGKAIALSKRSSLPEVGGDAAVYFDPERTGEMAQIIANLVHSENQRNDLESKIPLQLEKFDSQRIMDDYAALYNRLTSRVQGVH